jgi:hypothetical protein
VLVLHLTNNRLLLLLLRPLHILPLLINNPPWLLPRPLTQPDLQAINSQVPQHPFWPRLLLTRLRVTNNPPWPLPHPLIQPHLRAISNPLLLLLSLPQPTQLLPLATSNPLPLLLWLRPPIVLQPHPTKCPLELPLLPFRPIAQHIEFARSIPFLLQFESTKNEDGHYPAAINDSGGSLRRRDASWQDAPSGTSAPSQNEPNIDRGDECAHSDCPQGGHDDGWQRRLWWIPTASHANCHSCSFGSGRSSILSETCHGFDCRSSSLLSRCPVLPAAGCRNIR